MDLSDLPRLLNAGLALSCLAGMATLFRWWVGHPRETRFMFLSFGMIVAALGYGSLEAFVDDTPTAPRTMLNTVALAICAYSIIGTHLKIRRVKKARKKEKS